jgi:hypothetical protein
METQNQTAPNVTGTALATITREEIDVAISTAKKYPRSLTKFRQDAMDMATVDIETAGSCFYKLRRKNDRGEDVSIEGPTIRLAEIVASAWGNMKFGARIIGQEDGFVIAQGVAHDLETNVSSTMEVRRRITKKKGEKYGSDMIGVTSNAACAIAVRNAIFKTVPFTYVKQVYLAAKKTAVGDAKTLVERRQQMISEFSKMSVTLEQILEYTGKSGRDDIGLAEIEDLIGAFNAIKDGDTSVDEVFKKKAAAEGPKRASEAAPQAGTPPLTVDGIADRAAVETPGPATPPTPAEPVPEPTPPPAAPEPPPTPGPSLPNSGAAQAPTPPPRTNAPTGPILEFDDTITRTNSKDIGKGRTKYGICTGSGRWINTINDDAGRRANRLKGTNIQAKFKIVKNDYGFELVEMQEIPPGGLK